MGAEQHTTRRVCDDKKMRCGWVARKVRATNLMRNIAEPLFLRSVFARCLSPSMATGRQAHG